MSNIDTDTNDHPALESPVEEHHVSGGLDRIGERRIDHVEHWRRHLVADIMRVMQILTALE